MNCPMCGMESRKSIGAIIPEFVCVNRDCTMYEFFVPSFNESSEVTR